jgi:hypothetical protein
MSIMGNIRICQIDFYKSGYHELTDYEDIVIAAQFLNWLSLQMNPVLEQPHFFIVAYFHLCPLIQPATYWLSTHKDPKGFQNP